MSMIAVHRRFYALGYALFLPTEEAEKHRPADIVEPWEPFQLLTFASFVDNVWIAASSVKGALKMATAFEQELLNAWNQQIKPASREIMVPKGVSTGLIDLGIWKLTDEFRALGITIQANSETDKTWHSVRTSVLGKFFALNRLTDYKSAC